jgi:hypothetical protein
MPCAGTSSRSSQWRITAASPATGEFGSAPSNKSLHRSGSAEWRASVAVESLRRSRASSITVGR